MGSQKGTQPARTPQHQLALEFPLRPALGRDDFWVTPCNAEAVACLDRWPDWPSAGVALHGPAAAGKSHLVAVWRSRSAAMMLEADRISGVLSDGLPADIHAVAVDDAQAVAGVRPAEQALFHIINSLAERGGHLLLAAPTPPSRWPVGLPDLASRLAVFPAQALSAPDDGLLAALLVKQFADRQLRVGAEVITFLLPRMERSFTAARRLVEYLDAAALAEGRAVTVPLARRVLSRMSEAADSPAINRKVRSV